MKNIKYFFFIFFFLSTYSYALSIDEQINIMKNASPQTRVKMMNQLKRHLVQMKSTQRANIISKLKHQMNNSQHSYTSMQHSVNNINYHPTIEHTIEHMEVIKTDEIFHDVSNVIDEHSLDLHLEK